MKRYKDENGTVITENELFAEYQELKANGDTEAETFTDYIINCTDGNGTLTEIQ